MTLDVMFRNYLLDDSAIHALVSDTAHPDRIYPVRLPQKATLPAITFQQVSDTREPHLRGIAGIARVRYQVDAYALLPKDAKTLGGLIRQRLDGFKGLWGTSGSPVMVGSPNEAIWVQGVFFDTALDLFDEDINGGSSRHSADYFIVHRTAAGVL